MVLVIVAGVAAWWEQDWAKEKIYALKTATPLAIARESALGAKETFQECRDCPPMIVVPAGRFMMGSPPGQGDNSERPQHEVTIARPFAVSRFELTFDEWNACGARGDCRRDVRNGGYGLVQPRPTIYVNWNDAQTYVKWLSRITGKPYRLLSEAEFEYAARAESRTAILGAMRSS